VFLGEAFIALSLVFGLLTRLGSLVGFMMAVNLYLGLSVAPHEWSWSYGMLITLQLIFFFTAPGRTLGVDQYLIKLLQPKANSGNRLARFLLWLM
jgi:disulfide bond formation protein DsbB